MGQPPSDFPDIDFSASRPLSEETIYIPPTPSYRLRPEPVWRYVILFTLTVLTTTYAGSLWYAGFYQAFRTQPLSMSLWLFLHGLWYSVPVVAILAAHEFGHYFACRYYRIDASLPYFLPLPLPFWSSGTLGAVIRIRQRIPEKRALFDIGIAGPIAGFIVAVPVLLVGMYLSTVVQVPTDFRPDAELGEPLLFKAAQWLTFGAIPDGYSLNMHPMGFAAWFGMLATALNLFPIGQLDGGHIAYAVLGRRSTAITMMMVLCLIGLTFVATSWIVWTVLVVVMLLAVGPHHPRTLDEEIPLDSGRLWLAAFALLMFILCFTPAPIQPLARP